MTPSHDTTTSCVNGLEIRLAHSREEVIAAQNLRYRVFFENTGATPSPDMTRLERDFDQFDDYCDHLLVFDHSHATSGLNVIGTYRLLRRSVAQAGPGFYSAGEYDLSGLKNYGGEIVELGRSCIDPKYRGKAVMQLLWRGIADYIQVHNIGLMFGCASFPGTDLAHMTQALSYLRHHHVAPRRWRPKALRERHVNMKLIEKKRTDLRLALREMPPLIKGYLRVGAMVGDGAVIDDVFNTVDISIAVESENVTGRYQRHFLSDSKSIPGIKPGAHATFMP